MEAGQAMGATKIAILPLPSGAIERLARQVDPAEQMAGFDALKRALDDSLALLNDQ